MPKRKETPLRLAGLVPESGRAPALLAPAVVPPLQEGFVTKPICHALVSDSAQAVAGVAATSSAPLPPACSPSAPLRAGVPVLRAYKKGSTKAALEIIQSENLRQEAVAALKRDVYAASATDPRQSKLDTWETLARAAGFEAPFRLTPDLVSSVMGALKAASFRSAAEYLYIARQEHVARYEGLSQSMCLLIRQYARSVRRGLGAARHTEPLPLERFHELSNSGPWTPRGCLTPKAMLSFGSHFLLREIELANVLTEHVTVAIVNGKKEVAVQLPVSKSDYRAVGITRRLNCCCLAVRDPHVCPVCIAERQLEYWQTLLGIEQVVGRPLFPTACGAVPTKASVVDDIRYAAKELGLPLWNLQGQWRHTGHACRASGAIFYSLAGIEIQLIQLFARWGSDAFKIYILAAPLQRATNIASRAHATFAGDAEAAAVPPAPVLVLPDIPAGERAPKLNRLPVVGDDLVVNIFADGSRVAKEEGRLHAVRPGAEARTICGWKFGQAAGARRTDQPDRGVLCQACFNLQAGAGEDAPAQPSSSGSDSDNSHVG
jgi:hypothetical protein